MKITYKEYIQYSEDKKFEILKALCKVFYKVLLSKRTIIKVTGIIVKRDK